MPPICSYQSHQGILNQVDIRTKRFREAAVSANVKDGGLLDSNTSDTIFHDLEGVLASLWELRAIWIKIHS